jgi:hypothetical protein
MTSDFIICTCVRGLAPSRVEDVSIVEPSFFLRMFVGFQSNWGGVEGSSGLVE